MKASLPSAIKARNDLLPVLDDALLLDPLCVHPMPLAVLRHQLRVKLPPALGVRALDLDVPLPDVVGLPVVLVEHVAADGGAAEVALDLVVEAGGDFGGGGGGLLLGRRWLKLALIFHWVGVGRRC